MTKEELYKEACLDEQSSCMSGIGYNSRIKNGIKIIRDDRSGYINIVCINMSDEYIEINNEQLFTLLKHGWYIGSLIVAIDLYEMRLIRLNNNLIRQESRGIKGKRTAEALRIEISEMKSKLKKLYDKRNKIFNAI